VFGKEIWQVVRGVDQRSPEVTRSYQYRVTGASVVTFIGGGGITLSYNIHRQSVSRTGRTVKVLGAVKKR